MDTGDPDDGFLARQIGDMNKGIVEGGEDVCNSKNQLSFSDLGAEGNNFLFLHYLFLGRLLSQSQRVYYNRADCVREERGQVPWSVFDQKPVMTIL